MTPPTQQRVLDLDEIGSRIEHVLQTSCADEVEIVWLETRRRVATTGQPLPASPRDRSIMIHVLDRGRLGTHRTSDGDPSDLDSAVRCAVAQSRTRQPLPGLPHLPNSTAPLADNLPLWDSAVSRLRSSQARSLVTDLARAGDEAVLRWGTSRVVVANSRGVHRQARVTHAALAVDSGNGPGAGRAVAASRSLAGLDPETVFDRARRRQATTRSEPPAAGDRPLVLAAECVAELCDILKRQAFSACSYQNGSSFLRQHLGDQVFDRRLHLRDDGTDPSGLPFPFDLEGTAKEPVDLIAGGTPRTPALDQRQAAVLGLPPTGHSITGNDAQAEHLFLSPGEASAEEPLAVADGGLWFGSFRDLECFDPSRLRIRARVGGVRRIEDGRLGAGLQDVVWEDSLLRVLSSLLAIGHQPIVCPTATLLGGISAPSLAVAGGGTLRPA